MTKKQLLKVFFVKYHHEKFAPDRASDELFNSMMALTLDPARVYSLWGDMIE